MATSPNQLHVTTGTAGEAPLARLLDRAESLSASDLVKGVCHVFGDGLVMTTSFGAQSAVMLHLATSVVPDIPVVWIDTGYLFPETYRFAERLTERLKLNLHVYQSPLSAARMEALHGKLWQAGDAETLRRYDLIRKVEPMQRALQDLGVRAWLAGLRRDQTDFRRSLPRIQQQGNVYKVFPLLHWTSRDLHEYLQAHDLPYHPLFDRGYVSIGDWHSSEPLSAHHAHERDTRFRGIKQECGLHLDISEQAAKSLDSSGL